MTFFGGLNGLDGSNTPSVEPEATSSPSSSLTSAS